MNSKRTTMVLGVLLIAALAYSVYTSSQLSGARNEVATCKEKYSEALVDAQEAIRRVQEKDEEVKQLLLVAEAERQRAEEALAELQKRTRK
jgi:hypothetical protein